MSASRENAGGDLRAAFRLIFGQPTCALDATGSAYHSEARGRSWPTLPADRVVQYLQFSAAIAAAASMGRSSRRDCRGSPAPRRLPRPARARSRPKPKLRASRGLRTYGGCASERLAHPEGTETKSPDYRLQDAGGNRDPGQARPLMAAASRELSDWSILTSDNPRSEDPCLKSFSEMRAGTSRQSASRRLPDRTEGDPTSRQHGLAVPGTLSPSRGKRARKTYQEFAMVTRRFPSRRCRHRPGLD